MSDRGTVREPTSESRSSSAMGNYSGTTTITANINKSTSTISRRNISPFDLRDDTEDDQLNGRLTSDGRKISAARHPVKRLANANETSGDKFPAGRLSGNSPKSSSALGWNGNSGMGNGGKSWGTSGEGQSGTSSWASSWSALQGIASAVLGTTESTGVSQHEEEERKRRERIRERRRRAGLEEISGVRTSAASLHAGSSSSLVRRSVDFPGKEIENCGDGSKNTSLRKRGQITGPSGVMASGSDRAIGKRSNSPEPSCGRVSISPSRQSDADTLAYLHHVKETDTLEGIAIRYNIHPSSLRKANGLWSGDSIQYRKLLFLPVDECLVKGKPLLPEQQIRPSDFDTQKRRPPGRRKEVDLLGTEDQGNLKTKEKRKSSITNSDSYSKSLGIHRETNYNENTHDNRVPDSDDEHRDQLSSLPLSSNDNVANPTDSTNNNEHDVNDDPLYKHESYVSIDHIGTVEIVRLSRKNFSYFPPRRKKSLSVSSRLNMPYDIVSFDDDEPSSVFASKQVSEAYTTDEENFSQMLKQVAAETLEGVEVVGGIVEGYIRKFSAKVGDFVGDMASGRGADLIELTTQGLRRVNSSGGDLDGINTGAVPGSGGASRSGSRTSNRGRGGNNSSNDGYNSGENLGGSWSRSMALSRSGGSSRSSSNSRGAAALSTGSRWSSSSSPMASNRERIPPKDGGGGGGLKGD